MIPIILIVIGVLILFPKSISLSAVSELKRPRTFVLGIITIVAGFLASVIGNLTSNKAHYTQIDIFTYMAAFVIPLIAIPFLKEPKLAPTGEPAKTSNKVVNILGWLVLLGVVIFLVWLMFKSK